MCTIILFILICFSLSFFLHFHQEKWGCRPAHPTFSSFVLAHTPPLGCIVVPLFFLPNFHFIRSPRVFIRFPRHLFQFTAFFKVVLLVPFISLLLHTFLACLVALFPCFLANSGPLPLMCLVLAFPDCSFSSDFEHSFMSTWLLLANPCMFTLFPSTFDYAFQCSCSSMPVLCV